MMANAAYFDEEELYQISLSLTMADGAGPESSRMAALIDRVLAQRPHGIFKIKIIGCPRQPEETTLERA